MKKLFKNKLLVVLIVLVLVFFPATIGINSEIDSRAIVIGVGIDYNESDTTEKYEVSAQTIIPRYSSSFSENLQLLSAKGETIEECFQNLSLHLGKRIALAHANVVMLGEGACKINYSGLIDFFKRSRRLNNNFLVVASTSKARDVLKTLTDINSNLTLSLNNILKFNDEYVISVEQDFEGLINDYYTEPTASLIPIVSLENDIFAGIPQSLESAQGGESSGTGGSDSGSGNSQKFVANQSRAAVFKKGKQIGILDKQKVLGYKMLTGGNIGLLTLHDVNDAQYSHSTVTVSLGNKSEKMKTYYKNGLPIVEYTVRLGVKVEEIVQEKANQSLLIATRNMVTDALRSKIKEEVMLSCSDLVNFAKSNNADILKIYEKFHKFHPKQTVAFIEENGGIDNFLSKAQIYVNIDVFKRY